MFAATAHKQLICGAESLAQATFTDILLSGDDSTNQLIRLQKEFRSFVRLEACRYETLKADLKNWRERVVCGEVDFEPVCEEDFKDALRALLEFESFLIERFDAYRGKGLFLVKPRLVNLMVTHRKTVERILDSWTPPEWNTANEDAVKWDQEQTTYLRQKLASCE